MFLSVIIAYNEERVWIYFLFPYSKMSYLEFSKFTTSIQMTLYNLNEE